LRVSGCAIHEIVVEGELTNERVDLAEREGHRWPAFEVAAEKATRRHPEIQGGGVRVCADRRRVCFPEPEHTEDATDALLHGRVVEAAGVEHCASASVTRASPWSAREEVLAILDAVLVLAAQTGIVHQLPAVADLDEIGCTRASTVAHQVRRNGMGPVRDANRAPPADDGQIRRRQIDRVAGSQRSTRKQATG
jgi:hypothetical protein